MSATPIHDGPFQKSSKLRADQLDRDCLVRLCRSIARVCGLRVVDPIDHAGQDKQSEPEKLFDAVKIIKPLA
jgi:hypothetical protein